MWYNPLTWGKETQKNILDKDNGLLTQVGGWIGNMNLTKEEVMKQNAKTVTSVQGFVVSTLEESTDRSKTRRSIAVLWIKSQLAIIMLACIAAPWNMELANFYFKVASSALMLTISTAICIFFFGSHGIARIKESKK